jgi:hypothetical protein
LFAAGPGNKKRRHELSLIWSSIIWTIWRQRNKIIFYNGTPDLLGIVNEIKVASWKWWIGRSKAPPYLLYEWNQELAFALPSALMMFPGFWSVRLFYSFSVFFSLYVFAFWRVGHFVLLVNLPIINKILLI